VVWRKGERGRTDHRKKFRRKTRVKAENPGNNVEIKNTSKEGAEKPSGKSRRIAEKGNGGRSQAFTRGKAKVGTGGVGGGGDAKSQLRVSLE